MKTKTMILLGGAALVGYYLYKKSATPPAVTAPAPSATSDDGTDPTASDDVAQNGVTAVPQTVVMVQPDDSYDAYYPWGWGPSWGNLVVRGGGGRHHGGHGGGHGGHGGHR